MTEWRETIKETAKENDLKVEDLLALTRGYDPFYVGGEADHKKAKWAKKLFDWVLGKWEERKDQLRAGGIHIGNMPHQRAIHYLLLTGHPNPIRWDGKRYTGTHGEWEKLQQCFKYAKLLRYISFGVIEDHKHPQVISNLLREDDELIIEPVDEIASETFTADDIEISFPTKNMRDKLTIGYDSILDEVKRDIQSRIPVHIELWTEKERELVNIVAQEYWANVQNAVGQQTYENVYSLLERAIEESEGKPLRILYLTDFDPRGEMTMTVGVARIIEWMLANLEEFEGLDVRLKKIILTQEQIERYNLPPAPVKQTESMAKRWKDRVGNYVCEIDAIETLFATEMVEILRGEILRYIPEDIVKSIREYNTKLGDAITAYNDELDNKITSSSKGISEEVAEKIKEVMPDFEGEIEVDMSEEQQNVRDIMDEWEEPDWEVDDGEDEWLFDSKRGYIEQIKYYKQVREK